MNKKDKELLSKDVCARLSYGVKISYGNDEDIYTLQGISEYVDDNGDWILGVTDKRMAVHLPIEVCKPHLRPLSSITKEELKEFYKIEGMYPPPVGYFIPHPNWHFSVAGIDWLNAHHFDFRELIEKGLAIKVTDENNPYKIKD